MPDPDQLHEDLKSEYVLLQGQYEGFDQRALSIKGVATPLLGVGIGLGYQQKSPTIVLTVAAVALALWALEATWKIFQYCHVARIRALEHWFGGDREEPLSPFQIYNSWATSWETLSKAGPWSRVFFEPFVCLPYSIIVAVGVVSAIALI